MSGDYVPGTDRGTIEAYGSRGVYVPKGLTAGAVFECGKIIERQCEVGPYTARHIASEVLLAGAAIASRGRP